MSVELPQPIASYFAGQNDHDIHAMLALFAAAAIVKDEGQERRGLAAVQEWMKETTRKYRPAVAVTDVAKTDGKTAVTVRVSGTFPGSPVELRYVLTFAGDKISRLEILS